MLGIFRSSSLQAVLKIQDAVLSLDVCCGKLPQHFALCMNVEKGMGSIQRYSKHQGCVLCSVVLLCFALVLSSLLLLASSFFFAALRLRFVFFLILLLGNGPLIDSLQSLNRFLVATIP